MIRSRTLKTKLKDDNTKCVDNITLAKLHTLTHIWHSTENHQSALTQPSNKHEGLNQDLNATVQKKTSAHNHLITQKVLSNAKTLQTSCKHHSLCYLYFLGHKTRQLFKLNGSRTLGMHKLLICNGRIYNDKVLICNCRIITFLFKLKLRKNLSYLVKCFDDCLFHSRYIPGGWSPPLVAAL